MSATTIIPPSDLELRLIKFYTTQEPVMSFFGTVDKRRSRAVKGTVYGIFHKEKLVLKLDFLPVKAEKVFNVIRHNITEGESLKEKLAAVEELVENREMTEASALEQFLVKYPII